MKTLLKKVYYCDFCKKKGMSASAMSKHEKHCTLNPTRECGLCKLTSINPVDCPICFFSKLRLDGTLRDEEKDGYNFKTELDIFWNQYNKDRADEDDRSCLR